MGSIVLDHLRSGWHVDQAILSEEERVVLIRFGRDSDPDCMRQDDILSRIRDEVSNFCVIYVCDIDQVPDFNQSKFPFPSFSKQKTKALVVTWTRQAQPDEYIANLFPPCRSVRALRPNNHNVLLPEQTHDDRPRDWKQQQDKLGARQQTGAY